MCHTSEVEKILYLSVTTCIAKLLQNMLIKLIGKKNSQKQYTIRVKQMKLTNIVNIPHPDSFVI